MKKIRAVIWDVDGTLIDSEPLHYTALLNVSKQCQVKIDAETNNAFLGLSLEEVWRYLQRRHGLNIEKKCWMQQVIDYYIENVNHTMARPGVLSTMNKLASRKVSQCCVSTAERKILDANIAALKISQYLAFSISVDDVPKTKPSPTPYLKACELLGLSPQECIAVEDTSIGIRSATSAGIRTLAWPAEISLQQDYSAANAVISDLSELPWDDFSNPSTVAMS